MWEVQNILKLMKISIQAKRNIRSEDNNDLRQYTSIYIDYA
jgi:hypothetical protein